MRFDTELSRHACRVSLAALIALTNFGCGNASSSSTGGGGGAGSSDARPPGPPNAPAADGTTPTVLAMNKLLIGDTDPNGQANKNAWSTLGYDIDGLVSTPKSTNHCQPVVGGSKDAIQTDGVGGIDNSFGRNLLPILTVFQPATSQRVNQSLTTGDFTILFALNNLGAASSQTAVSSAVFGGAALPVAARPPKFDGTDVWPVESESVANHDITQPTVTFPDSYLVNGTWVSGSARGANGQGAEVDVQLIINGLSLNLHIVSAVISMHLSGRGSSASANNGVIAGVMDTETFVTEMRKLVGAIDPSLCASFDTLAQTIRGASDIMLDGSNGDPTKTCNAISIGLGFTAAAAELGPVVDTPTPPPPCGP